MKYQLAFTGKFKKSLKMAKEKGIKYSTFRFCGK